MNLDYKDSADFNEILINTATSVMNSTKCNPFRPQNEKESEDEIIDPQMIENAKQSFQSIIEINKSGNAIILNDFHQIYEFLSLPSIQLANNQQFLSDDFADSILISLLPGNPFEIVEKSIEILQVIWSKMQFLDFSLKLSPITQPAILERLLDALNTNYPDSSRYFDNKFEIMKTCHNYLLLSPECKEVLLSHDFFHILQGYLMEVIYPDHIEAGLDILYDLIQPGLDDVWAEIPQFFPIFPKVIQKLSEKTIWILSTVMNDDRIFNSSKHLQLHSLIAQYCAVKIKQEYAFYFFKCAFAFARRGYQKVFVQPHIFDNIRGILEQKDEMDISPIFFVLSILIDNYGQKVYDFYDLCLDYADQGLFANKIGALYCIAKFIVFSPLETTHEIAHQKRGLEVLCNDFHCFDNNDVLLPLKAIRKLIEAVNTELYIRLLHEYSFYDSLTMKLDEIDSIKDNGEDNILKEILWHMNFIIHAMDSVNQ